MPYTVSYDPRDFVLFKYAGIVSSQEALDSSIEGIRLAQEHDSRLFLADHTDSIKVLPIEKVYDLMDKLAAATGVSRNSKLAIALPANSGVGRENLESFENLASNQGWLVAAFDTCQQAVEWLLN